ncbi:TonB-dependent receptor [Polymorphobacter multimanifer]|nr:TonB-dependent siderophore receptor [Polymorphobacter multimanifer]
MIGALLAASYFTAPAVAQDRPDDDEAAKVEDIIVTGTRLTDTGIGNKTSLGILGERPILDTPFSVTSFTEALIRNTGARSLSDVLVRDPSVSADSNPAGPQDGFAIRGFFVGRGAYMYDGIPGLTLNDGYLSVANLERVEVFRGANAFLAGASPFGGVGGAINLVPKRPGDAPVNEAYVGYQSDSPLAGVDFSRRFGANQQFGVRFNGYYQSGNGAVDQLQRRTENFALFTDWKPSDTLYLSLELQRFRDRTDGYRDDVFLAAGVAVPRIPDLKRNYLQPWTFIEQSGVRWTAQARWEFVPGWSVQAGYGKIDGDRDNGYYSAFGEVTDNAGTIVSFPFRSYQPNNDIEAGQFLLKGKFSALGGQTLLTAGYTLSDTYFFGFAGATPLAPITSNLFNPVYVPAPAAPQGANPSGINITEVRGWVGMAEQRWFDERLSVLAGVRKVDIKLDTFFAQFDDGRTSPFGALSFKPTVNSTIYASYTEGLERGGTAPVAAINANETLPPGITRQYELGGKIDLGGLLATAAVFEISRPLEFINAARFFVQDGRQTHRGAELQLQGSIRRDVRVISGITYLDATIDNGNPALKGNRPLGVPEWTGTLFVDADIAPLPGLTINGGLIYKGPQFADLANTQRVESSTRVDAGARYAFDAGDTRLTARLSVENILNDGYWSVNSGGGLLLSSPRTVRLSLSAEF